MITDSNNSELTALKNQIFTLLVALIVVSGTLTVYLYRQASLTNKDIAQAQQMFGMLAKNQNSIETFVGQLAAYGEKHPDFLPVLKKYGIQPRPATPGMAPAPVAPKK